jgi:hypothetical protein
MHRSLCKMNLKFVLNSLFSYYLFGPYLPLGCLSISLNFKISLFFQNANFSKIGLFSLCFQFGVPYLCHSGSSSPSKEFLAFLFSHLILDSKHNLNILSVLPINPVHYYSYMPVSVHIKMVLLHASYCATHYLY